MRKFVLILSPLIGAAVAPQAVPLSDVAQQVVGAGLACILSADKNGATQSSFDRDRSWVKTEDGTSFRHASMPIAVTFPKDNDGVGRICEVRATLASQAEQASVKRAFETSLKRKPFEQSDSSIWMFSTKVGPRGLQLFPDKSIQPHIRLIGAAF